MTWFSEPGAPGESGGESENGQPAVVSVLRVDKPVGAGVLLTGETVLTCAHVVNDALSRHQFDTEHPGAGRLRLALTLPGGRIRRVGARVATWIAPRGSRGGRVAQGAVAWEGDLAVLVIDAEGLDSTQRPTHRPTWRPMRTDQKVRAWSGAGADCAFADAMVEELGSTATYLDAKGTGARISPGYSGSPLWCGGDGAMVGIVAGQLISADGTLVGFAQRTLAFSWQTISEELRKADLDPDRLLSRGAAGGWELDARTQLADWIDERLPHREDRARHARYVAERCELNTGREGSAPTAEQFAAALLTRPRSFAALLGGLRATTRSQLADELLRLPAAAAAPGLLSPSEYRTLTGLLTTAGATTALSVSLLRRIVAEALPDIELPPLDGQPGYGPLVQQLELYTGGFSSAAPGVRLVPALLRVAEFLAADVRGRGGEDVAQALWEWSLRVAARLGVSEAALHEHRAAAASWAATRAGAVGDRPREPRVMAYLTRHEATVDAAAGRFNCAVWLDSGQASPRRAQVGPTRAGTPEEIARLLREIAEGLEDEIGIGAAELGSADEPAPVLEIFLDQPDLALAVEDWDCADADRRAGGGLREPLGMTHPLVVRLAMQGSALEVRRRSKAQAKRWRHRDSGVVLLLDDRCGSEQQVKSRIYQDQRTARVVLRQADPAVRAALAEVCLRHGVPIVLWDREWRSGLAPEHFEAGGPAEALPERLRVYRAVVYGDPEQYPARPVLAREDPTRPSLPLFEAVDPEAWLAPAEPPLRLS
ncbi:VMAP-C domain-containing protein [Kitasatospora kifunensis]|uniref:vWA-MoxR associated protein C-terminal domain-containing protein n=1 Tax=Kitasatospora kifunensis TaxID=58351 RepID=A0A7W7VT98_KITKI|nr:trypsin-like peptidase domain-containing protein [Kitasatospora kifunensis]MBB4921225.1 hypothetical protein [Kitasatospora kifunensis]